MLPAGFRRVHTESGAVAAVGFDSTAATCGTGLVAGRSGCADDGMTVY